MRENNMQHQYQPIQKVYRSSVNRKYICFGATLDNDIRGYSNSVTHFSREKPNVRENGS